MVSETKLFAPVKMLSFAIFRQPVITASRKRRIILECLHQAVHNLQHLLIVSVAVRLRDRNIIFIDQKNHWLPIVSLHHSCEQKQASFYLFFRGLSSDNPLKYLLIKRVDMLTFQKIQCFLYRSEITNVNYHMRLKNSARPPDERKQTRSATGFTTGCTVPCILKSQARQKAFCCLFEYQKSFPVYSYQAFFRSVSAW